MSEMCEGVNITTQVINKLSKFNKVNIKNNAKLGQLSQISNIHPHTLTNYLSKHILNKSNVNNSYTSMEHLIEHFKF
jgi:DNA-directed RNA polymerase subunit L